MPDLPLRANHEKALQGAVAAVFLSHQPGPEKLRIVRWGAFQQDLHRAVAPLLAGTFTTSAEQLNSLKDMGVHGDAITAQGQRWADTYTDALTRSIADNSRKMYEQARQRREQLEINDQEFQDRIDAIFGEERAEAIGVTETTRAATFGEKGVVGIYGITTGRRMFPDGTSMEATWNCELDGLLCEECEPLDGTTEEEWPAEAMEGPPLHPWCRCWLTYGDSEEELESADSLVDDVDLAAAQTDPNPSEEQKKSGNYRKGRVRLHGLHIAIENARGSVRAGRSRNGTSWSVEMKDHYGYIKRTRSEADQDHVDCFIGPHPESEIVFVIDQIDPATGQFDEHKCMIGWTSEKAAKQAYVDNFSPGWKGFQSIHPMTIRQFKNWLRRTGNFKESATRTDAPLMKHIERVMESGPKSGTKWRPMNIVAFSEGQFREFNLYYPVSGDVEKVRDDAKTWDPAERSLIGYDAKEDKYSACGRSFDEEADAIAYAIEVGKAARAIRESSDNSPQFAVIENFPDIRQPDHFSCGAASAFAVGKFFGVGPATIDEWKAALDTNVKTSTRPKAIADYLTSLGLETQSAGGMTISDLAAAVAARKPVICCIQDYSPELPDKAGYNYGHYVSVIGVVPGFIIVQDSSHENAELVPGGDVPPSKADDPGSIEAPGKVLIEWATWERKWQDQDANGNKYDQFGIVVGPKQQPSVR